MSHVRRLPRAVTKYTKTHDKPSSLSRAVRTAVFTTSTARALPSPPPPTPPRRRCTAWRPSTARGGAASCPSWPRPGIDLRAGPLDADYGVDVAAEQGPSIDWLAAQPYDGWA